MGDGPSYDHAAYQRTSREAACRVKRLQALYEMTRTVGFYGGESVIDKMIEQRLTEALQLLSSLTRDDRSKT